MRDINSEFHGTCKKTLQPGSIRKAVDLLTHNLICSVTEFINRSEELLPAIGAFS